MNSAKGLTGVRVPATAVLVAAALLAGLCASSCATPAPAPAPAPVPVAEVRLAAGTVTITAIDIDSVCVSAELRVSNEGEVAVILDSLDFEAGSETPPVRVHRELGSASLAAGAATVLVVEFDFDAPAGTDPMVPLHIQASVAYASSDGTARVAGTVAAVYDGEFPRIMAPTLRIASIRILKDELINTKLRVDLEVTNPNAFPLSFGALDYRLFGEGLYWAGGSIARAFVAPARESTTASLYLTMNFTDMSRSLLDQVIKLAAVNYRIVGAGRIDTGLAFLPQFALPFDMSGKTQVMR